MKTFLSLFLVFTTTLSFGFHNPGERKIVLKAGAQGIFYVIVTSTANDEFKIKYMLNDSVSTELRNDELYKSTSQTLLFGDLKKIEDKVAIVNTLDSITQKYTYYTTDSLLIKKNENPEYQQVFDSFFSSPTEYHLKNNRIVLDGITMVFTLSEGSVSRKIYAQSPDKDSNPVMYEFISQTMNLYRKQKPEGILSKRRTYGY